MRIVSILENQKVEKRIAITPDSAKKYIALGFEISLAEKYGEHLGFKDNEYIPYLPGDYCEGVIPDPIPNSEVKPFSADGTLS